MEDFFFFFLKRLDCFSFVFLFPMAFVRVCECGRKQEPGGEGKGGKRELRGRGERRGGGRERGGK